MYKYIMYKSPKADIINFSDYIFNNFNFHIGDLFLIGDLIVISWIYIGYI